MRRLMRRLSRVSWIGSAITAGSIGITIAQTAPPPDGGVPVEALLNEARLGESSLSPDGRVFVYTVCDAKSRYIIPVPTHQFFTAKGTPVTVLGCGLWIVDTREAQPRKLTTGQGNSWAPSWSPDGRSLAFYSDQDGVARVWIWSRNGRQFRRVSDAAIHPKFSNGGPATAWTPDSAQIIVSLVPGDLGLEAATTSHGKMPTFGNNWKYPGSTVRVLHANRPGSAEAVNGRVSALRDTRDPELDFELAYINVASGAVARLGRMVGDPEGRGAYFPSPDREQIAVVVPAATTNDSWNNLWRLDIITRSGNRSTIVPDTENLGSVSWSPNGRYVAVASGRYEVGIATVQIQFVRLADGVVVRSKELTRAVYLPYEGTWDSRSENFYCPIDLYTGALLPRQIIEGVRAADGEVRRYPFDAYLPAGFIRRKGSTMSWWRNGRGFILSAMDSLSKDAVLLQFDPASGRSTVLRRTPEAYKRLIDGTQIWDVSADGRVLVIPIQSSDRSADYYVFDRALTHPHRLTDINPELSKVGFGKTRLIQWQLPDGTPLAGTLLLPSNYVPGRRYPAIIEFYPGADYSYSLHFFGGSSFGGKDNLEAFATRGYAVLRAQTVVLPDGKVAQGIADGVVSAANKLIELGIADPGGLGVMGGSFGGYGVMVAITRSSLFKAAVVIDGPADLPAIYGALENDAGGGSAVASGVLRSAFKLGGTLWEKPDYYIQNSPVFSLDKVQAAVLVVHGAEDDRVPVAQGREIYADLSMLGKEVELRQYDGEGHAIFGFSNQADMIYSAIRWFDDHLRGAQQSKIASIERQ